LGEGRKIANWISDMLQVEQILQNRYQLSQKLGQNPSRQTWLARDLERQDLVVVKLLTLSDKVEWQNLKLFEREAQILKQLNHPRIPKYRDYFCIDDRLQWFGLVHEYIPGVSLKEQLAGGKAFSEEQVRAIARHILKILTYLHQLSPPVLHRDIKPSNLILGEDKYIYLIDFGAVQDKAAAEGATFTVVGTYGYAPLEQLGGRATPASDLYALGATLIHLLTGVAPADLPQQDARLQFANLVTLNPGFVRWLWQLTEPNVSQRFHHASEALEELEANEDFSYAIARSQPNNSNIQLQKSPHKLKIKISRVMFMPQQIGGICLIAVSCWFASLTTNYSRFSFLSILLVMLASGLWLLLPGLAETIVYFDHQSFEIQWKLFGFCWRRQRGQTLEIDGAFKSEVRKNQEKIIPEVILAAGVREYIFGRLDPPLTEVECYWLVEEIKNWLGLKEREIEEREERGNRGEKANRRKRHWF
jgi:serine/threonine protein kinase